MSDIITGTEELARAIGQDVGALARAQDETARALAALRQRLAVDRAAAYAPVPAVEATTPAPTSATGEPLAISTSGTGTGMDATTGAPLDGWAHVEQSIGKILTTRIGARVMLREFGSDLPRLIDANATPRVIMQVFVALAEALDKWEPRFRIVHVALTEAGPDGRFAIEMVGIYYPRGHLGDFADAQARLARSIVEAF